MSDSGRFGQQSRCAGISYFRFTFTIPAIQFNTQLSPVIQTVPSGCVIPICGTESPVDPVELHGTAFLEGNGGIAC